MSPDLDRDETNAISRHTSPTIVRYKGSTGDSVRIAPPIAPPSGGGGGGPSDPGDPGDPPPPDQAAPPEFALDGTIASWQHQAPTLIAPISRYKVWCDVGGETFARTDSSSFDFDTLGAGPGNLVNVSAQGPADEDHWAQPQAIPEPPPPPPPPPDFWVEGTSVKWHPVEGAVNYKIAYGDGPSGPAIGYINPISPSTTQHTFVTRPAGVAADNFYVSWAYDIGAGDVWFDWLPITVVSTDPPPPGPGTVIFTRPPRTVNFVTSSHTGYNNFWSIPTDVAPRDNAIGVKDIEVEYNVTLPSNFRWSNGGFKTPGPGGAVPGSPVPNGCELNPNGWSARLQWDGFGGSTARVAAYPYLLTRDPPEVNGLDVQPTANGSNPCGTIIRNPNAGIVSAGNTYNIRQRIQLNSSGQANGRLRVWLDGVLIIDHPQLRFSDNCRFLTHMIEVWYFGGTNFPPQNQSLQAGTITVKRMS